MEKNRKRCEKGEARPNEEIVAAAEEQLGKL
jgi:hypothetical protein